MTAADVSVIVPAYQAEASIGRALASIAAQTVAPKEVIVVDDGSSDDTAGAARGWVDRMPGTVVKVLHQENLGAGAARNRAIREATGRYLAFLDADDEWLPEKLAESLKYFSGDGPVLVAHNSTEHSGGEVSPVDCATRYRAPGNRLVNLYKRGFISTSTVVADRAAVVAADGFDTTLANAQDFDLWLTLLAVPGADFLVFDDVLTRYHVTSGSVSAHTERRLRCVLQVARRHFPLLGKCPGWPWSAFWFRVLAGYYEAHAAHRRAGRWFSAFCALLRAPIALAWQSALVLLAAPPPRVGLKSTS